MFSEELITLRTALDGTPGNYECRELLEKFVLPKSNIVYFILSLELSSWRL